MRSVFDPLRSWTLNSATVQNWRRRRYIMLERLCALQPNDRQFLPEHMLRRLFPDAEIHRKRVLGLTKSLIAVRR